MLYLLIICFLIAAFATFRRFEALARKVKLSPKRRKIGRALIGAALASVALFFLAVHKGYYRDELPLPAPFNTTSRLILPVIVIFLFYTRYKFPEPDELDEQGKAALKKHFLVIMSGFVILFVAPLVLGVLSNG